MRLLPKIFRIGLRKEKQLLQKAKKDKNAFGEIYKYFVNDVYRYSYSILNNKHDAEDITSQTFIEFYKKLPEFEWKGLSLRFWLIRTAKNLCMRKLDQPKFKSIDDLELPDEKEGFVEKLINNHMVKIVEKEIKELDIYEREIISLRISEGLKFKEIAEIQNISENAAKKRFYSSLQKLRKLLEKKNIRSFFSLPFLVTTLFFINRKKSLAFSDLTNISQINNLILTKKSFGNIIMNTIKNTLFGKVETIMLLIATFFVVGGSGGYYAYANFRDKENKPEEGMIADAIKVTDIPKITPTLTKTPTVLPTTVKPTQSNTIKVEPTVMPTIETSIYQEPAFVEEATFETLPSPTETPELLSFISPIDESYGGTITQYASAYHMCLDIVSANKDVAEAILVASEGGTVEHAGFIDGGGAYTVIIDHGNGYKTSNSHIKEGSIAVNVGDTVTKGQQIGIMGNTGLATGIHTHFCLEKDGVKLDPLEYMKI